MNIYILINGHTDKIIDAAEAAEKQAMKASSDAVKTAVTNR